MLTSSAFANIDDEFLKAGHTHNGQDQRFSTAATVLSRAPVLEDPWEFKDWMLEYIKPVRGRKLHVEVLNSTMNFQKWQVQLDIAMSGLTPTSLEPDTNRCWRFSNGAR